MLHRIPDYYQQFHCLAGACPHSCCEKWEVVIDDAHICQYETVSGVLGEKLRAAMTKDEYGDICFSLIDRRCPFLDSENLCEIHRQLGEESTSITCQEHPRFTEDYGTFQETSLSASCPAANALLLGSEAPLTFTESFTHEPEDPCDPWLDWLLPLRNAMISLLQDRTFPLRNRLFRFLAAAQNVQGSLDSNEPLCLSKLPQILQEPLSDLSSESTPFFPGSLQLLSQLEILDSDWQELLLLAESAAPSPVSENLLERIAVYLTFRYLLKCVNDGDLLGRAQFVVLGVLVIERLSAVCGLSEALRRFSCEIEHNDENLTVLSDAFYRVPALSPGSMLRELSPRFSTDSDH